MSHTRVSIKCRERSRSMPQHARCALKGALCEVRSARCAHRMEVAGYVDEAHCARAPRVVVAEHVHAVVDVCKHARLEASHIHNEADALNARRGHPPNVVLHVVRHAADSLVAMRFVRSPRPAFEERDGHALLGVAPLLHRRLVVRRSQRRLGVPEQRDGRRVERSLSQADSPPWTGHGTGRGAS